MNMRDTGMITYVTLGTLPPPPEEITYDFRVGDRILRKNGRQFVGIIERINSSRAHVRWLGANVRRLGAASSDKYGSIHLSNLCHACDKCNKPAIQDDIFCATHRQVENALWTSDLAWISPRE
jgi:hypothetical protein